MVGRKARQKAGELLSAPSGAYKRFRAAKTLAQGGFTPPEHVKS